MERSANLHNLLGLAGLLFSEPVLLVMNGYLSLQNVLICLKQQCVPVLYIEHMLGRLAGSLQDQSCRPF